LRAKKEPDLSTPGPRNVGVRLRKDDRLVTLFERNGSSLGRRSRRIFLSLQSRRRPKREPWGVGERRTGSLGSRSSALKRKMAASLRGCRREACGSGLDGKTSFFSVITGRAQLLRLGLSLLGGLHPELLSEGSASPTTSQSER